jgi:hypothetical protein
VPVKIPRRVAGPRQSAGCDLHQRVETAAQEQRINTEKQKKLAEDQRKLAEESRAAADQAYNQKMGLNTEQYVALQAIQMQRDVCAKGTCTFIYGANATPMLNLQAVRSELELRMNSAATSARAAPVMNATGAPKFCHSNPNTMPAASAPSPGRRRAIQTRSRAAVGVRSRPAPSLSLNRRGVGAVDQNHPISAYIELLNANPQ